MSSKPKTRQEAIDVLLDASKAIYGAKQAIVRGLVPYAAQQEERAAKADWVDDVLGEDGLEGLVTRLREAESAFAKEERAAAKSSSSGNGKSGQQRGQRAKAASKRVKESDEGESEETLAKPKRAPRSRSSSGSTRTKGGGGKVTAQKKEPESTEDSEPAPSHKVEVPA